MTDKSDPQTLDFIKLRPHHCGISVPDMEAAIAWYRDTLGFTEALRLNLGITPAEMKIVFMKHGDFYMEIFQAPPDASPPCNTGENMAITGIKHICFWVDDLQQAVKILKKRGVSFVRDVSNQEHPKAAHIRDNFGNIIELVPPEAPEPL